VLERFPLELLRRRVATGGEGRLEGVGAEFVA
jgi:hypothetical protein